MVRSVFFFLMMFLALSVWSGSSYAQCDVSVKLISVEHVTVENKGKINFRVEANGPYECILSTVSGSGIEEVTRQNGSGNDDLSFGNLEADKLYQVLVIFKDETEFLCKKRVIADVLIEEKL